jgi:hypothetical protein
MGIPPLGESFISKGPSPLAKGQDIIQSVFGEQPEITPVSSDKLLQELSEHTPAQVQPTFSLVLDGLAIISGAAAASEEK